MVGLLGIELRLYRLWVGCFTFKLQSLFGRTSGLRSHDFLLIGQVLYQLSYSPILAPSQGNAPRGLCLTGRPVHLLGHWKLKWWVRRESNSHCNYCAGLKVRYHTIRWQTQYLASRHGIEPRYWILETLLVPDRGKYLGRAMSCRSHTLTFTELGANLYTMPAIKYSSQSMGYDPTLSGVTSRRFPD